jgi:adenosylcobinamide-GDP ribazoletransferase
MNGRGEFFNALRFMTIVPVPSSDGTIEPDWLSRCAKYFPAIGIGVGLASAVVWLLADRLWGPVVASLLAVAASVVITGALHEDGLADTADSLGGASVEKRLAIMKDSRIGTYGTLALMFSLALRVTALADLPGWTAAAALIAAHAAARLTPVFVMNALPYAGDAAAMKVSYVDARVSTDDRRFALILVFCALLPLALVSILSVIAGLLLGTALAAAVTHWAQQRINGYTGDVLGAIEQAFEIGFLLGVAAVMR